MIKKIFFLGVIMVSVLSAGEKLLAKVQNIDITGSDLQAKIDTLPPQYVSFYSSNEGKQKLLEQMVQEKLFYLEAKNKNLEKDPEVVASIAKLQQDVMLNYYLKKELAKLTVSDKEISDYYASHQSEYSDKAKIRASHILVKTKAEADKILSELQNGANFEQEAKEKSTCPSAKNGGDLNYFSAGDMVKPFEEAAFALKPGEITKTPVETQFGWHIIKVTDKKEAKQKDLEEVKGDIRNQLLYDKQKAKIQSLTDAAKQKYPVTIY